MFKNQTKSLSNEYEETVKPGYVLISDKSVIETDRH